MYLDTSARLNAYESQLSEYSRRSQTAKADSAAYERRTASKVASLEETTTSLKREIKSKQTDYQCLLQKYEHASNELQESLTKCRDYERQVRELQATQDRSRGESESLTHRTAELLGMKAALEFQVREMRAEMEDLADKLDKKTHDYDALLQRYEEQGDELHTTALQVKKLEDQLAEFLAPTIVSLPRRASLDGATTAGTTPPLTPVSMTSFHKTSQHRFDALPAEPHAHTHGYFTTKGITTTTTTASTTGQSVHEYAEDKIGECMQGLVGVLKGIITVIEGGSCGSKCAARRVREEEGRSEIMHDDDVGVGGADSDGGEDW